MIKNRIEYIAFRIMGGLFRILGITLSRKLALFLGKVFFYIVPLRKGTVISNLKTAFPNKSDLEIKEIAKKTYRNFALTFCEMLSLKSIPQSKWPQLFDFSESDELLKRYFSTDKSFFLLTGHFGNWELLPLLPALYKRTLYAMAKPLRNNLVSDWINSSRERFGMKVVLVGISIREIYQILKEKGAVAVVGDQRGPSDGVRVNFFGRSTAVFNGTAVLALKTASPIVLLFFVRQDNLNYKIITKEFLYQDIAGTQDEKIQMICQGYFSFLESLIKEYPDQWFWMHKIWKH